MTGAIWNSGREHLTGESETKAQLVAMGHHNVSDHPCNKNRKRSTGGHRNPARFSSKRELAIPQKKHENVLHISLPTCDSEPEEGAADYHEGIRRVKGDFELSKPPVDCIRISRIGVDDPFCGDESEGLTSRPP